MTDRGRRRRRRKAQARRLSRAHRRPAPAPAPAPAEPPPPPTPQQDCRAAVAAALREDPARSNRAIAADLNDDGVYEALVTDIRHSLEQTQQIHAWTGRGRLFGHSSLCWCGTGDLEPPQRRRPNRTYTHRQPPAQPTARAGVGRYGLVVWRDEVNPPTYAYYATMAEAQTAAHSAKRAGLVTAIADLEAQARPHATVDTILNQGRPVLEHPYASNRKRSDTP